jgi:glycosyltransferase involved in cell wall biosynthesis
MILIVAPYDGALPERTSYLAGAKKIREIIKAQRLMGLRVVLLNSGHQRIGKYFSYLEYVDFDETGPLEVITPAERNNSYYDKVLNIIDAPRIIDELIERIGVPDNAWFYNGYAFEMRCARYLSEAYGTRTILEFEDWHFARNRGLNPKPYIDWAFWRLAVKHIDAGYAVNMNLRDKLRKFGIPTKLLPGIVTKPISDLAIEVRPFSNAKLTIGYFGGLYEEKGAASLLKLVKESDPTISFIVTGTGPLQPEFARLTDLMPDRVDFRGAVSEAGLVEAMALADVIVNAHHINDGVFPFKVLEALASGRLLISTELPMHGYEIFASAIHFYDGTELSLLKSVTNAREIYNEKKTFIDSVAEKVAERYGQLGLVEDIRDTLRQCRREDQETASN